MRRQAIKLLADLSSVLCVLIGWIWGWIYRSTGVDSVKLIGESNSAGLYFEVPSLNEETLNLLAGALNDHVLRKLSHFLNLVSCFRDFRVVFWLFVVN